MVYSILLTWVLPVEVNPFRIFENFCFLRGKKALPTRRWPKRKITAVTRQSFFFPGQRRYCALLRGCTESLLNKKDKSKEKKGAISYEMERTGPPIRGCPPAPLVYRRLSFPDSSVEGSTSAQAVAPGPLSRAARGILKGALNCQLLQVGFDNICQAFVAGSRQVDRISGVP